MCVNLWKRRINGYHILTFGGKPEERMIVMNDCKKDEILENWNIHHILEKAYDEWNLMWHQEEVDEEIEGLTDATISCGFYSTGHEDVVGEKEDQEELEVGSLLKIENEWRNRFMAQPKDCKRLRSCTSITFAEWVWEEN